MKREIYKKGLSLLIAIVMVTGNMQISTVQTEAAGKKPTKITLSGKSKSLTVGETYKLKVKTVIPKGASKKVTYKSGNKKIATVSSTGKITAKKAGKTTITVTSKSNKKVKATCKITVYSKVKSVKISTTKKKLKVGEKFTLSATISPSNAKKDVVWKTTDKKIVTVSTKGVVTAKKSGTAVITVSSKANSKKYAKCIVTVTDGNTKVPTTKVTKIPTAKPTVGITKVPVVTVEPTKEPGVSAEPTAVITKEPGISSEPTGKTTITPGVEVSNVPTKAAGVTKAPEISINPTVGATKGPEVSVEPTQKVTTTPGVEVSKVPAITEEPEISVQPTKDPEKPSVTITESAKEPTSKPSVTQEPQKPTNGPDVTEEPLQPTNEPGVTEAPKPTDKPIPTATPAPTLPIVGEVRELGENDIYSDITGPRRDSADTTIYDCIYFGNYPQSDKTGETMEPIKWRVLSVKGTDAFVMADSILDFATNSFETWSNCLVRSWLNGYGGSSNSEGYDYSESNFIDKAFTKEEQDAIMTSTIQMDTKEWKVTQDKIYLLSSSDVVDSDYGFTYSLQISDKCRERYYSSYAYSKYDPYSGAGAIRGKIENCFLLDVKGSGKHGICPVFHLDLSKKDVWTAAGQVRVEKNENRSDMADITVMHPGENQEFSLEGKSILTYKVYEYATKYTYGLGNSSDIHAFSEAESFTIEKTDNDTLTLGIPEDYTGSGLAKQLRIIMIDQDEKEYTYDIVVWMIADDFAYNVCDGEAIVLEYIGEDKKAIKELYVPSTLGDIPVTKVASGFLECNELVRIKAGEGIREIDLKNPYSNNENLLRKYKKLTVPTTIQNIAGFVKELEFADGITEVPAQISQNVTGLCRVDIPETVTAIGDRAFVNQSSLKITELPKQVTSYGEYAFYQCNVIIDELPNGIKNVESYAFHGCNVTAEKLPESIENIGEGAFYDCAITINELPSNLVTINKDAFYGSTLADTLTVPPSVEVASGLNGTRKLILAEGRTAMDDRLLNGVTSIEELILPKTLKIISGENVFKSCKNVKELSLPNSIESVSVDRIENWISYEGAFTKCPIKKIIFEDGWEVIPYKIFNNNRDLEEVVIPDSVTKIGSYAFQWTNIKNVRLPKNIRSIGSYAFQFCGNIETLTIPAYTELECSDGAFAEAKVKTLELEDGITKIPDDLFKGIKTEEIILPDSVTSIGAYAFFNSKIKRIKMSSNIQFLGGYAFGMCGELEKLIFPVGMDNFQASSWGAFSGTTFKTVEFADGTTKIQDNILSGADVEEVILPDTVKEIGDSAFYGCKSLKTIELPEGLEKLGPMCFHSCEGLEEITIPSTVKEVGGALYPTFEDSGLKKITFAEGTTGIPSSIFQGASKLTEVVLPESMKTIGSYAFMSCKSLETIHLPESLISIGNNAFYGCTSLKEITIPKGINSLGDGILGSAFEGTGIEIVYFEEGRTVIPSYAFHGCETLKNVVMPSTLEEIGSYAFFGCENIETINIPQGVKKLGEFTFGNTTSLKSIVLPKSLVEYGNPLVGGSFEGSGLETVVLEEGTTQVYEGLFMDCEHLTSVQIPNTVKSIGNRAFYGCKSMTEFTISPMVETLGEAVFYDSGITRISVPASVKSCGSKAYSAFDGENIQEVTLEEGFEEIYDCMFAACAGLTKVNCPTTLRKIGDNAFISCDALPSFTVPDGVTSLGVFAFADCDNLKSVAIPASVTSIEPSAFEKVTNPEIPYPTIITTEGSTAHTFAVQKGYPFSLVENITPETFSN